jgi:hypothetical protein
MILCDLKRYPIITIRFEPSDWASEKYMQGLNDIHEACLFAVSQGHYFSLLVEGNSEIEDPPLSFFPALIKFLIRTRSSFKSNLISTSIYKPTTSLDKPLKFVLSSYDATRPVTVYKNHQECLDCIKRHRDARRTELKQEE